MDIFEFELRHQAYTGLFWRYDIDIDESTVLDLVKRTDQGKLEKKIQETSVEELWEATRATYTSQKSTFISSYADHTIESSGKTLEEYLERLEYELKVIYEMGYNTYFLIVQDYINRSKENDIVVGPGRGSCAGSLLSYVIGITDIDPLEYDLIFERFLNPGRISMPDIDTDFEDTQRDRVIEYMRETYGDEKVAYIGTYMTMAAKAAFKDVARVYGVSFDQSNILSSLITEKTIEKSIAANKELKEAVENDSRIKKVVTIAKELEGTVRQTGVHACGMIIAPEPTTTYSPIQHPPKSGSKTSRDDSRVVSQYEGPIIEDLGLLKMDVLGLRNLSIIKNTLKIIKAKTQAEGKELQPMFQEFFKTMLFHPPLDDTYTFTSIFHTGNTSGVFQFESDGMKNWLKKLKPTVFDDLIAMVSLYRPGPMEFIPHYIDRKYEIEKVTYMGPELKRSLTSKYGEEVAKEEEQKMIEDLAPFMSITYGIAVYQEQLMRLVQAMAGFSMPEADKLRKGVGKKIKEVIEKVKIEFIEKSANHRGYKIETAQWTYEKMIEPAADYSFNKSHAACYAYISYQTAYLKAHYPLEFHAALLRSVEDDTDKLAKFVNEVQLQGYKVCLPDVNRSFEHVAAVKDEIILGFRSIKGIGSDIARQIEEERTLNGNFTSLSDFFKRMTESINKKSLEALIKSGSLDQFEDRFTLIANTQRILDRVKSAHGQQQSAGLFAMEAVEGADLSLPKAKDEGFMAYLQLEYDIYKTLISAHPLDGMFTYIRKKHNFISMFKDVEGFGEFTILGFIKSINRGMRGGFFVRIEDITGEIEVYLSEKLDFKVFDIVCVSGRMGRSPRASKIQVFTYEELKGLVEKSGTFDPSLLVSVIRRERLAASEEALKKSANGKKNEKKSEKKVAPKKIGNNKNSPNTEEKTTATSFLAPEDMSQLKQIPGILSSHPGNIDITIGSMKASVNQAGLEKVTALCPSSS